MKWIQEADMKEVAVYGKRIISFPKNWSPSGPLPLKVGDVVCIFSKKLHAMILEIFSKLGKSEPKLEELVELKAQ